MAVFIALEGIDGSGKTVQFELLKNRLLAMGKTVATRDYPVYESKFGKVIGGLLSGKNGVNANDIDPMSMALWFAMDRFDDMRINPVTDADYTICNRYVLSNIAYQSMRSTCPESTRRFIYELEHVTLGLPVPDAYIFFDVDTANAGDNVSKKGHRDYVGGGKDVYESSKDTQISARNGYLECAKLYKNVIIVPCVENGALLSKEVISERAFNELRARGLV